MSISTTPRTDAFLANMQGESWYDFASKLEEKLNKANEQIRKDAETIARLRQELKRPS